MPIPFLAPDDEITAFPAVSDALEEPNGLLMAGGSLSPQRLLNAYRQGIFPWYEEGEPILWWSPNPRCVISPKRIRITRSLKKTLRGDHFEVTENLAYREVMMQCGEPRANSNGTWITDEMIDAYCALKRYGLAQSIEVWMDKQLAGGLYGIALGRVFVGESMFSKRSDASKIALVHLAQCGKYDLIDCQLENPHLLSMGAESITRDDYLLLLQELGDLDKDVFSTDASRQAKAEIAANK